jgi:hypothetical protein
MVLIMRLPDSTLFLARKYLSCLIYLRSISIVFLYSSNLKIAVPVYAFL